MKRTSRILVGAAVSAACMALAFRSVPVHQLLFALTSVSWVVILTWLGIASLSTVLRSIRWRILLSAATQVPLSTVFSVYSAGQLGNAVLPARLGDVFRATSLGRVRVNSGFTLATILGERLLDTGFLVSMSTVALSSYSVPAWLMHGSRLFAVLAMAGLAFVILLPRLQRPVFRFIEYIGPEQYLTLFSNLLEQFITGLRSLQHPGRITRFLLCTVVIWTADVLGTLLVAHVLTIAMSPGEAVLLLTGLALSSALPAAPGNIGVYQLVAVSILAPLAVSRPRALALAILLQGLILLVLVLWGLAGLLYLRYLDSPRETPFEAKAAA